MNAYFNKLGRNVRQRWSKENFSLETFSAIACAALAELPPAKRVNLPALLREFLLNDEQPEQTTSPFGEPELIVYAHRLFQIQLLFWLDGSTAIHQHAFSGAFHVLDGSSIHTSCEFAGERAVTPHFSLGELKVKKIEFLESGRTMPITSGSRCIHSLFHLESPSVTIVIRTNHDPGTDPQFSYLPPHVAHDPFITDRLAARRNQVLNVLHRANDGSCLPRILEMIEVLDFERGFLILLECVDHLRLPGNWDRTMKAFRNRHGKLAAGVEATLKETVRRKVILDLRGSTTEPEHRLFLALLANVPARADLFTLVAERFPKKPAIDTVLGWAKELTEVSDSEIKILDATFPAELAIGAEALITALACFMTGKVASPGLTVSAAKQKQVRSIFAASSLGILLAPSARR